VGVALGFVGAGVGAEGVAVAAEAPVRGALRMFPLSIQNRVGLEPFAPVRMNISLSAEKYGDWVGRRYCWTNVPLLLVNETIRRLAPS
jgi:hypothetical protein